MGVKLHFLVQRFHPQDRKLYGLYEKVAAAGKYLLLHVGNGPVGNEFVGIANFRRLLEDFPDLPAIVAHMGGLEYGEFGLLLNRHPALYLDTSYSFLPPLGRMFDLGNEFLEVNRERILYGSDFPNVLFPRELEIETLLALDLSEDFYRRVFWENGRALIERITGCSGGLINQTASVSVTGRP
jgi:predicted TIM-barrel fold metal-dependent hydrolase